MDKKMEIVNWLAENGYCFFDESPEHFAKRFDLETLKLFKDSFSNYKSR